MIKIIRALIVEKNNESVAVNFFSRFKDEYDVKISSGEYNSKQVQDFVNNVRTRNFGEFLRDKSIGDILDF